MAVVMNPFGEPKGVNGNSQLKKFLFAVSKEMGLYPCYNSDNMVKSYKYCREALGDEFNNYFDLVRKNLTRQEAEYQKGRVAINYITDVFTKFPQIIQQLKKEGKWSDGNRPDGWSVDEYGNPCHKMYRLVSQGVLGYTFSSKDETSKLPPLIVVYNKESKEFKRVENLETGEVLWETGKEK